ncbi:calcineurin-like phosphoesterase C-terminal domain-containing protein [Pedobacter sp. ASV12]|uniref:calcineurin-like phosphoesterase C-terminal domain-containing protein n=1 Tax=Pedobacter sp. ASV12 TaxID=2795120 RepID=UPI0018EBC7D5|nr:calcineurin-like phosphoesterase family protein [Pedobacter sp. ASV12]
MNRRSFLQQAGLFTTAFLISLKGYSLAATKRKSKITGRITDKNQKGIAGVIVSDGYSVVVTDKSGNYALEPNEKAKFVWLSVPAGYEFITEKHISRHYHVLGNKTEYNFELEKLKQDDNKHNFIIWADSQVKNKKDVAQMMSTSVPDTIKTIKAMNTPLVHGIGVGDLVWDDLALFPDYDAAVAQMGIPFFQALGNHDMDYRQGGDETSDKTFSEYYGPTYYSFNRGKAHYIVLDDVRYLGKEREYDGFITQAQLDWMAKDLKHVAKDALLIISLHIPVHNAVKNNQDFYALLKGYTNVHIMSGHTHYNRNVITDGIFEHNHGTVCGAWWTGPICGDGAPRGYGVYQVEGTKLKWHYQGTGLDQKEQLRIYVDELTNQKRLIANVWNWDPEWKVEYFLDDKAMGQMAQQKGVDPMAVQLYQGDKLPAGRTFAEPSNTDHLFLAHFAPSVKKVKVVATDRFGEQYVAEVI